MDFLNGLVGFLGTFGNWALNQLRNIAAWAHGLIARLAAHLGIIKSLLGSVISHLHGLWTALAHLKLSTVWATLKKLYDRYNRWMLWWQRHIQAPLDRIHQQLDQIYQQIFAPIIRFLDALRGPLRILALFDKRLAAKLDGFIFGLEQRILAPLLTLYQRINRLSSYMRAIITTLGFFDRVTLIESIRRDASIVWQVLTNPHDVIYKPDTPTPRAGIVELDSQFKTYVATGGGPLAPQIAVMDEYFLQYKTQLG